MEKDFFKKENDINIYLTDEMLKKIALEGFVNKQSPSFNYLTDAELAEYFFKK